MDAPRQPPAPSTSLPVERSARRDRRHTAVMALPWALIVLLWWRVLRTGPGVLAPPAGVVAGCALLTVTLTAAWVAHNQALYRAKGPRTGLPAAELAYDRDWTGRPVRADWDRVRAARVVVVDPGERAKAFYPAGDGALAPAVPSGGPGATPGRRDPLPAHASTAAGGGAAPGTAELPR